MLRFLKTTILGGILFLVPIVIFIAVIGKAFLLTDKLAQPIANLLPFATFGGIAVAQLIAIVLLVLVCFLAGLAATTSAARHLVHLLETNVLDKIPAYALMKTKTDSILSPDDIHDMQSVLVQFDDSWQIAFQIQKLDAGKSLVFLPGAPEAWSGSICVVTSDRVQPLAMTIKDVGILMKRLGRDAPEQLHQALLQSA